MSINARLEPRDADPLRRLGQAATAAKQAQYSSTAMDGIMALGRSIEYLCAALEQMVGEATQKEN